MYTAAFAETAQRLTWSYAARNRRYITFQAFGLVQKY